MTSERFLAITAFSILMALGYHTIPKAFAEANLICELMEC